MFKRFLFHWNRDERAAAMTEFVIGLPIYILIFSGMGALYRLNEEGLKVRMTTVTQLTKNQKANHFKQFIPSVGALASVNNYADVFQNAPQARGMWRDSYNKVSLPYNALGGTIGVEPRSKIEEITLYSPTQGIGTFANDLLNDKGFMTPYNGSSSGIGGIPQILMNVISGLGVPLAIGAGIRYGASEGNSQLTFTHPWTGTITYDPEIIDTPAPTASHHRIAPVAIARLETWTECPWDYEILRFNLPMASCGTNGSAGEEPPPDEATECQGQAEEYGDCLETCDSTPRDELDPPRSLFDDCLDYCDDVKPSGGCASRVNMNDTFNTSTACAGQPCVFP